MAELGYPVGVRIFSEIREGGTFMSTRQVKERFLRIIKIIR